MTKVALVRVRGDIHVRHDIKKTLRLLRLYKKHNCVIVENSPNYSGMIDKVKDYITWGEIHESTVTMLLEKRGKLIAKKQFTEEYLKEKTNLSLADFVKQYMASKKELADIPGLKPFFKLNPPRKGFGTNGVKKPYSLGGALGYRKEAINELIHRMI